MDDLADKPQLLVFHSRRSGRCRRVEGFLAQVLQQGKNHSAFWVREIAQEERPEIFKRFRIAIVPTLIVVENRRVRARLEVTRGAREIRTFLYPWLNGPRVARAESIID